MEAVKLIDQRQDGLNPKTLITLMEILGIPLKQIADFVSSIAQLGDPEYSFKILNFISEMLKNGMNDKEILDVIEHSRSFLRQNMDFNDFEQILNLIKIIPQEKRGDLIRDAKLIFADTMSWSDQMTVLYVMTMTPYHIKNIGEAEKYFTSDMPWTTKLNLFLYAVQEKEAEPKVNFDPVIDEILHPITKEEVSDIDVDLEEFFCPLPVDSLFADTDLVLCKEDFKGTTLNGIKLSELKEIEALANEIFTGKGRIKIDSKDQQFEKKVQGYIKKLLTRAVGRNIIKAVMNNTSITSLTIKAGTKDELVFRRFLSDLELTLSSNKEHLLKGHGKESQMIIYSLPQFLVLGHELIHVSHFPEFKFDLAPSLHPEYGNLEEQITITGFKKNIELPDSLTQDPLPSGTTDPDWKSSFEAWEKNDETQGVFNDKNFTEINERNLTAAFANSRQLFYPRFGHQGGYLPLFFMKEKIANNLFQQAWDAPLALRKIYGDLFNEVLPPIDEW